MNIILLKLWVFGFYRAYSGFLFLSFLLLFGFFRAQEHLAMAQFFVGSSLNLLFPASVIVSYIGLFILYSNRLLFDIRNRILFNLIYTSPYQRFRSILLIVHWLLFPATVYGLFLLVIAVRSNKMVSALLIFLFFLSAKVFISIHFNRKLITPPEKVFGSVWHTPRFWIKGEFALPFFLLKHITRQRTISFLLTKLVSFFNLYLFSLLIPTVDHYQRFLCIAVFLAFASNGLLPLQVFYFQQNHLSLLRNLPIRRIRFYFMICITLLVMLLPEIIYIYRSFLTYLDPVVLSISVLGAFFMLLLVYSLQYARIYEQGGFPYRIFWGFLFLIVLLLYDFPVLFLLIIFSVASVIIFYHYFYIFEITYKKDT